MPFVYGFSLIALPRTYTTMLNSCGNSGHTHLVPDLKRKAFNLSLLSMMLTWGLPQVAFVMSRPLSLSTAALLKFLNHEWKLNFVKYLFSTY